jgi:putative DNA primase/helicase
MARRQQLMRRRRQDDHKQRNADAASSANPLAKRGPTDPHRIAQNFLHRHWKEHGEITLHHRNGDFWKWNGMKYKRLSPGDVDALITEFAKRYLDAIYQNGNTVAPPVKRALVADIRQALAAIVHVSDDLDPPIWIGKDNRGPFLAFKNGLLPIAALESGADVAHLQPHSANWFSTVAYDYSFSRTATCPQWLLFLNQVLEGDAERIAVLQEWFGYTLTYDNGQQKLLLNIGEGANGKSVAADVWTGVLGADNVSSVPLERFGGDFDLFSTLGKLANFCAEPGPLEKRVEGILKQFIGEDRMYFNRKFRDPVHARPTARVIVMSNNLPTFKDRTEGIWRRAMIMPFNVTIPEAQRDPKLAARLKQELPGIFLWAWEGRRRLYQQKGFTKSIACDEAAREFRREADPARLFLTEHCCADAQGKVGSEFLYGAYKDWSTRNGHGFIDEREFGKVVRRVYKIEKKRPKTGELRVPTYYGIRFEAFELMEDVAI